MEGYDSMDNNLNNGSGIPNVSDIKFEDTPAESFENIYGGGASQEASPSMSVDVNDGVNMILNPEINNQMPNFSEVNQVNSQSGIAAQPSPINSVGGVSASSVNQIPVNNVQSEPQINVSNSVNVSSNSINNSQSVLGGNVAGNPSNTVVNPTQQAGSNGFQSQSVVESNPGFSNQSVSLNATQSVNSPQVDTSVNMGVSNVGQVMTSNPVDVSSNGAQLSDVSINAEKMQSIEEQLSKTSQYNPSDFQQEQIVIPTDNQSDKSKSGLTFVVVLFIILGVAIALMPQIIKMIK